MENTLNNVPKFLKVIKRSGYGGLVILHVLILLSFIASGKTDVGKLE